MSRASRYTLFYTSFLLVIGIGLSMLTWSLYSSIVKISNLGEVINIAGKQRMLSQRIIALTLAQKETEAKVLIDKLITDQKHLLNAIPLDGSANIPNANQAALTSIYHQAPHSLIKNMSLYIESIQNGDIIQEYGTGKIMNKADVLLSAYNAATREYQVLYETEINSLKNTLLISSISFYPP